MKKTVSKAKKLNNNKKKLVGKVVKVTKKIKVVAKVKSKVKAKAKPMVKKATKIKTKIKVKVKAPVKAKIKTKAKVKTQAKAVKKVKVIIKAKKKTPAKSITKAKVIKKAPATTKAKVKIKTMVKSKNRDSSGPIDIKPYQSMQNEEYMSDEQLEHFRTVLLQWKGQLMAEVDRTMHYMKDEASNYPDPVDRATQEEEFNLELRARDRERKLLRKIDETLNRINDRDYGYCDDCGAEIGIRRLEARPTAAQCIECKTIAEIKEKQIGDGS